MIWLFKIDEVFKSDKPKVNDLFDVNDIGFDITLYDAHRDISLYMDTPTYFLLSDTNPEEIYYLDYSGLQKGVGPVRNVIKDTYYYNVVSNYYRQQYRENQLNQIGI